MRNDFGTRPYKSRFPYKKGKSAGRKKQGYAAREDESLRNAYWKRIWLRNNLSKRVEMNLMVNGAKENLVKSINRN